MACLEQTLAYHQYTSITAVISFMIQTPGRQVTPNSLKACERLMLVSLSSMRCEILAHSGALKCVCDLPLYEMCHWESSFHLVTYFWLLFISTSQLEQASPVNQAWSRLKFCPSPLCSTVQSRYIFFSIQFVYCSILVLSSLFKLKMGKFIVAE